MPFGHVKPQVLSLIMIPDERFALGFPGALPEDYREERLPGSAVGSLHHTERR